MTEDLDSLSAILALRTQAHAATEDVDVFQAIARTFEGIGEQTAAAQWYVRASKAASSETDPSLARWCAEQAVRACPGDPAAVAQLALTCAGDFEALSSSLKEAAAAHDASPLEAAALEDTPGGTAHAAVARFWRERGDSEKAVAWFLKGASHAERNLHLSAALELVSQAAVLTQSLQVQRERRRLEWLLGSGPRAVGPSGDGG